MWLDLLSIYNLGNNWFLLVFWNINYIIQYNTLRLYFAPSSKKIVNNNNNNNNDNNKTLSQVFIYEFCEIVKNIFLQNISGDYYNISGDYFLRQQIAKPIRKGIVISRSCCTTKLFHFLLFFVLFVHYGLMLSFIELFFYRNIYTINKLTLDK